MQAQKSDYIIKSLQADILRLQGFKCVNSPTLDLNLGPMRQAFPNHSFPLGAVHEFLCENPEDAAATTGFIAALQSAIMGSKGAALWISTSCTVYPPALRSFGLHPDRIIFLHLKREKELLWAMEEALKCKALSVVVGELNKIDFMQSRRLQLAVEQSQVTGFIIHHQLRKVQPTACVSRWRVSAVQSARSPHDTQYNNDNELPGVGFPKWNVQLLRMRNGKPGAWNLLWMKERFWSVDESKSTTESEKKKAG